MGLIYFCKVSDYKISDFHNGNIELLKKGVKNFFFVILLMKTVYYGLWVAMVT